MPVAVKIPGSELALARKGGAEHTLIDFIGEVKDEYGVDGGQRPRQGGHQAERARRPRSWPSGRSSTTPASRCCPAPTRIKFLARDDETGRIGTYMNKFVIPNLNKEEKRIPISSVVLSSQRVDDDATRCSRAGKDKTADASNPLVQDGQKLIPSVTRVFSTSRDMYVYLQAYEPAATTTQPLVAFVTFYRGQTKAFETPPLPVTEGLDTEVEGGAAAVQPGAEQAAAGRVQLPGDGARSDGPEGGVLAGAGDAGAVRHRKAPLHYCRGSV